VRRRLRRRLTVKEQPIKKAFGTGTRRPPQKECPRILQQQSATFGRVRLQRRTSGECARGLLYGVAIFRTGAAQRRTSWPRYMGLPSFGRARLQRRTSGPCKLSQGGGFQRRTSWAHNRGSLSFGRRLQRRTCSGHYMGCYLSEGRGFQRRTSWAHHRLAIFRKGAASRGEPPGLTIWAIFRKRAASRRTSWAHHMGLLSFGRARLPAAPQAPTSIAALAAGGWGQARTQSRPRNKETPPPVRKAPPLPGSSRCNVYACRNLPNPEYGGP
jgi:hypothetical protein